MSIQSPCRAPGGIARAATEPEIAFSQTEKPAKTAPDVKHVKMRSSVDVMAELETLRKKATQTTPKTSKKDPIAEMMAAMQSDAA